MHKMIDERANIDKLDNDLFPMMHRSDVREVLQTKLKERASS